MLKWISDVSGIWSRSLRNQYVADDGMRLTDCDCKRGFGVKCNGRAKQCGCSQQCYVDQHLQLAADAAAAAGQTAPAPPRWQITPLPVCGRCDFAGLTQSSVTSPTRGTMGSNAMMADRRIDVLQQLRGAPVMALLTAGVVSVARFWLRNVAVVMGKVAQKSPNLRKALFATW